jgi:phosphatidylserine decarboxylase
MNNFPVAKESFIYIVILAAAAALSYLWFYPVAIFLLIILAFIIFFFRNPKRIVPEGKNIIVSPADGTVMSVTEIDENDFIKGKAVKVSIFLSLFNVHINRSPVKGTVRYTAYRPGKYLPAFKSHASDINERNTIGVETEEGVKIIVHQITGFVARRIVCWVNKGDRLEAGERFGLIKFGSCTEIIMPAGVNISVKPGDKVRGSKSIIGVMN